MYNPLTLGTLLLIAALIILTLIVWLRWRRKPFSEPVIELEKLVKCRGCGSLIPEGARKCAFCGAWQRPGE